MTTKNRFYKGLTVPAIASLGFFGLAACSSDDSSTAESTTETVTSVSTVTDTATTSTATDSATQGQATIETIELDGAAVDTASLGPLEYKINSDGGVREIDIDETDTATADFDVDLELRNDAWILDDFSVEIDSTDWETSDAEEAAAVVEVSEDESTVRIETEVHNDDNEQETASIVVELALN
ncbi:MAG: hypothetical protein Q3976_01965 [Corynebacterium sp.]|nr:hypothetical protein [Corynebacterium sp.]